jgi:hypothetical protein
MVIGLGLVLSSGCWCMDFLVYALTRRLANHQRAWYKRPAALGVAAQSLTLKLNVIFWCSCPEPRLSTPIGLIFSIVGARLTVFGTVSDDAIGVRGARRPPEPASGTGAARHLFPDARARSPAEEAAERHL